MEFSISLYLQSKMGEHQRWSSSFMGWSGPTHEGGGKIDVPSTGSNNNEQDYKHCQGDSAPATA